MLNFTGQMWQMHPPEPGLGKNPCTVNGRTYTCAVGATITVPDFDAGALVANGWQELGYTGTTAQRPAYGIEDKNKRYLDTTLGYQIIWSGKNWRNPTTGAAV